MTVTIEYITFLVLVAATISSSNTCRANDNTNWFSGWFDNNNEEEAVSLMNLENYWVDAIDVVTDLDSYDKLWIKPHSCVWSECAIDDTDDGYMGDNRDGDEQWYQYRTQGFCANAGYSLYGQKNDEELLPSFLSGRCNRRHFINSFFTYGGADTLLLAIGETPEVYYYGNNDDNNNNNNNNNNNDDDGNGIQISENAICYQVDEYNVVDDYFMNNYNNGNNDEDDDDKSNSGDSNDNYDGYAETLGCGPTGDYVVGAFQSASCDGNYFAGVVDTFTEYNAQHNAIGCHTLYEKDDAISVENVMLLLNNSWSCDLRLYPDGCPDPYRLKEKYDFAMRTVIHGGNAQRAYRTMTMEKPIHIVSWIILCMTVMVFLFSYLLKNERRAINSKGGKSFVGYMHVVGEDLVYCCGLFGVWMKKQWKRLCAWVALLWSAFVVWIMFKLNMDTTEKEDEEEEEKKKGRASSSSSSSENDNNNNKKDDDGLMKNNNDNDANKEGGNNDTDVEDNSEDSYVKDWNDYVDGDYVRHINDDDDDDIEAVVGPNDSGVVSLQRSVSGISMS